MRKALTIMQLLQLKVKYNRHFLEWQKKNQLKVHEEVFGFYTLEYTTADSIVLTLKDILLQLSMSISNCRGQCSDSASNLCGIRSGVSTQISDMELRSLCTHCHGHALNLAIKGIKVMADSLDKVYE